MQEKLCPKRCLFNFPWATVVAYKTVSLKKVFIHDKTPVIQDGGC